MDGHKKSHQISSKYIGG